MFELTPAVWIAAGIVLAVLEMFVPGLVVIWFGIAAIVAGVVAFFVPNPYVQFGVFAVLSLILILSSQRIARRITHPEPEPVGSNRMVGATGRVVQAIVPPDLGRVKVDGEEWRAGARERIEVGAVVRVIGVEGTRLTVEPFNEGS